MAHFTPKMAPLRPKIRFSFSFFLKYQLLTAARAYFILFQEKANPDGNTFHRA
jgi:hypothetical protein